jgi:hypothetical protein
MTVLFLSSSEMRQLSHWELYAHRTPPGRQEGLATDTADR